MAEPVNYPKGDLRRMLAVLGAIAGIRDATLVKIAARTCIDKKTVTTLIAQAGKQARVQIDKNGPVYEIADWGPVFKKSGAEMVLTGALNAPNMATTDTN